MSGGPASSILRTPLSSEPAEPSWRVSAYQKQADLLRSAPGGPGPVLHGDWNALCELGDLCRTWREAAIPGATCSAQTSAEPGRSHTQDRARELCSPPGWEPPAPAGKAAAALGARPEEGAPGEPPVVGRKGGQAAGFCDEAEEACAASKKAAAEEPARRGRKPAAQT